MDALDKKFILKIIIITVLFIGILTLIYRNNLEGFDYTMSLICAIFSAAASAAGYFFSVQGLFEKATTFMNFIMGGFIIKFFANIGLIAAILVLTDQNPKKFVVAFFCAFFLFSGIEVYSLLIKLRQNSKKPD